MLCAVPGSGGPLTAEFEVSPIGADGAETRATLFDSAEARFDLGKPVRSFSSRKRQRHFPGLWWSSTIGRHVGYESWLERDHLMLLDFDPSVVGIASQPFWLFWDEEGRRGVTAGWHRAGQQSEVEPALEAGPQVVLGQTARTRSRLLDPAPI
jgi:hypothetical protein